LVERSDERAFGFDNEVWASWDYLSFELRLIVKRLQAPLDAVTRRAVVVLRWNKAWLAFRQCRQNLPHFQMRAGCRARSGSGKSSCQPLGQSEVDGHEFGLVDG
jgi:hypothetical protein